jgi:hypothetical protein
VSRPSVESFDICSRILVKGVLILSSGVSLLISSIFFQAAKCSSVLPALQGGVLYFQRNRVRKGRKHLTLIAFRIWPCY